MVIGRLRRTLKRGLSIAMAAALMVTSVPQLSVSSMAQEEQKSAQNEGTDEYASESAGQDETEEKSQSGDSAENASTEEEHEDSEETRETDAEQSEGEDGSEESGESDIETDTDAEEVDEKELGQDETEEESETEEEETKVSDSDKEREEVEGKLIYENNFDNLTEGTELANGTVAKLSDGNMAIEYDVDLSKGWEDAIKADSFQLESEYNAGNKEKLTMSFDVYFPDSVEDIGTIEAQAVLRNGGDWDWKAADPTSGYTTSDLVSAEIDGYKKLHVSIDAVSGSDWTMQDITALRAITPCLAGVTSTYTGKVYLDNVVLTEPSTSSGEDDPNKPGEEIKGTQIYENDLNTLSAETAIAGGIIKELANGNMAVEYDADLSKGWEDALKADSFQLESEYNAGKKEKLTMSFDVYFPDSVTNIGTIEAQAVLRNGENWDWKAADPTSGYTTSDLVPAEIDGYKKLHVSIDAVSGSDWTMQDITALRAITFCLVGNSSTYKGKLYLDNISLRDTSTSSGEDEPSNPDTEKDVIYQNDFDTLTTLEGVLSENVENVTPVLAELVTGNKAVKYSVTLGGGGWEDIFKAQFNLSEPYSKKISEKVVMSYDVYFPIEKILAGFDSMKAQATLSCGSWVWASAKEIPEFKAETLIEDSDVPGFKKAHVEIDMTDFETWDDDLKANKPYPFDQITPIQAVIPCFAGAGSTYEGDLYLDNLEVWAVNESGSDIPPVEGDLPLDLDVASWEVDADPYQYTGEASIENRTVGDTDFLVFNVDYSNDSAKDWSEAKFDYTHPSSVATLRGYNAFKADIYYKPANMTAGGFGIKLFSNSPEINVDTAVPAGEPADIPGLEGYYKAEYVLNLRIPAGEFQNLTLGFVGKSTDYKGAIYLDNMRFTQIVAEDIYVDSTMKPEKGAGVQVVDNGRNLQTASGKKVAIAQEVALADANANESTKNLYAYLKAVGESDSVIFGHQNDTHHKAGSKGDDFSNSDTKDVTGSIAGVIGIDSLSLTGNEASEWNTPEAERIAKVAEITREAAAEGALVTLSAHMPNFDVIDKRVKAYDESGQTATGSDGVGYWIAEDGSKQYNFSGYTPGTLTGNVVARVMPGQDLNYLYTDYLDLIADYAKAVENDGITILFRPLHENTGSWFWWGAALCDEQAYIALYRYTVDYLKETRGVHNMIYVYGPGSEAANVAEYSARYPGDAYVDMIGYDLYHSNPSQENEAGYLESIRKQNAIIKEFAEAHNKLYAITETGVANGKDALLLSGNEVMDWYMQLLDEISDDGVCYFLVWANFGESSGFYLPYVVEKKENGVLHGHEMMDEFIKFYNDERSVFATDMNSEFEKISGVTNTTEAGAVSGYIIAPQSGDRLLTGEGTTRIAATISGDVGDRKVQFIAAAGDKQVVLEAALNNETKVWEALLTDEQLLSLGEIPGTITLNVGEKEIAVINARFNLEAPVQDDMVPEDFESYAGSNRELNSAWPTNKASGSELTLVLTEDAGKVFGGKYGMQMNITLAQPDAYVGATKSFEADWSQGNALELYTIPEAKGQKVVVQVKSGGEEFEVWLNEYEDYAKYAAEGTPVKVTIPFSALKGKNNGVFDPAKIEVIGLWCNALPNENVTYPLSTTICYDEMRVVTTEQTTVQIITAPNEPGTDGVSGNIITPQAGDRILSGAQNPNTRFAAKISGVEQDADVRFVAKTVFGEVVLKGIYNAETDAWEAVLEDSALQSLGRTHGTVALIVNEKEIKTVTVKFNMPELAGDNMVPEDFEGYTGDSQQLENAWVASQTSGSGITLSLTDDKGKVTGGNYALQMDVVLADKDAWAGVVKDLDADWSAGNALEFDTIPVANGQKVVVQVISGGIVFEAYLQDIEGYAGSAVYDTPVKVTIPFSAFVGKDDKTAVFDSSKIEGIGLGCGAPENDDVEFPLDTTLCYDEFKIVTTDKTDIRVDAVAKKGIWIKAIPNQTYTGKAIKPDVQVYDDAKLLTPKKDYTVSYKNNTKAGQADIIIKGKGNYSGSVTGKFGFTIVPKKVGELTITAPDYLIENGKDQKIAVTVKDGKKKLSAKNDYTQEIVYNNETVSKAKAVGVYTIKITMKGNYEGDKELTCEVADSTKLLLGKASVTLPSKSLDYKNGEEVRFEDESKIIVKLKGKVIPQKEDDGTVNYTVSYENHRQVGTASVIIKAGENSNYVGSCSKTFTINGMPFTAKNIEITDFQTNLPYTGKAIYQNPVLKEKNADITLEKDVDYKITYQNNRNAGKATMVITGLGKYSGTLKNTFTIEKVTLTSEMLANNVIEVLQNRAGATPDVTITYNGKTLVKDRDYKLTYTNNKNITTDSKKAYISIAGKGNYSGSLKNAVELKITPKSWDSGEITVEVPDMKYGSKAQYTPNPVVYDNGTKLNKNKDYTVAYTSNKKEDITEFNENGELSANGHEAEVIITLIGADYVVEGEAPEKSVRNVKFRIIGKLISEAKVKIDPEKKQFYSQYGTRPTEADLIVTYKTNRVETDEYQIISYGANDKKGKATLVIAGKGQYGGTKKVTYTINARILSENLAKEFADAFAEISAPLIEQLQ